jgi:hypothetical protein
MALLPGYQSAYIPISKIRDYSLNTDHEEGKHKAIVFQSALGIGQGEYPWLIEQIRQGIAVMEAVEEEAISFGKRYRVDLTVRNREKEAIVRTTWIIRNGEDFPRLTSCYVL